MESLQRIWDLVPGDGLGDKLQVLAIAGTVLGILYGLLRRLRRTDVEGRVDTIGAKIEQRDAVLEAHLKSLEAKLTKQIETKEAVTSDGARAQASDGIVRDLAAAIATLAAEGKTGALAALDRGDHGAADKALADKIAEIETARGAASKEEAALYRQRGALAFLDDTYEALQHYTKATDLNPEDAEGWTERGHLQLRVGDLAGAQSSFERVLRLGEHDKNPTLIAVAAGNLGLVYFTRGDFETAEAMHKKALALCEHLGRKAAMAVAYGNLGNVYLTRGNLDGAEAMYKRALAIDQALGASVATHYGNLGIVYRTRGAFDRAEAMHKAALAIDEAAGNKEGVANHCANLGIAAFARNDLMEAERMHKKALEIDKELSRKTGMATDYSNLGNVYWARGNLDEAEAMYTNALGIEQALGRKDGIASDYGSLGNVYRARGDLDAAETMYKRALAIDQALGRKEGIANAYGNLGVLYESRGDLDQACVSWRQARDYFLQIGAYPQVKQAEKWLRDAGCPVS